MTRALVQGTLFDAAPYVAPARSRAELGAEARAFVARLLRRRVCRDCRSDEQLLFRHTRRRSWDVSIARLVQLDVADPPRTWPELRRALTREIDKCVVVCRACHCRRLSESSRPKMLWCTPTRFIGMGAKAPTTSGGGENAIARRSAKRRAIVPESREVA